VLFMSGVGFLRLQWFFPFSFAFPIYLINYKVLSTDTHFPPSCATVCLLTIIPQSFARPSIEQNCF
jgi:hypothetical protein